VTGRHACQSDGLSHREHNVAGMRVEGAVITSGIGWDIAIMLIRAQKYQLNESNDMSVPLTAAAHWGRHKWHDVDSPFTSLQGMHRRNHAAAVWLAISNQKSGISPFRCSANVAVTHVPIASFCAAACGSDRSTPRK
jgi:hypothetical protein